MMQHAANNASRIFLIGIIILSCGCSNKEESEANQLFQEILPALAPDKLNLSWHPSYSAKITQAEYKNVQAAAQRLCEGKMPDLIYVFEGKGKIFSFVIYKHVSSSSITYLGLERKSPKDIWTERLWGIKAWAISKQK